MCGGGCVCLCLHAMLHAARVGLCVSTRVCVRVCDPARATAICDTHPTTTPTFTFHSLSDPFVLVSGDTVSNVSLRSVVDAHKARRARDPACVMTILCMVTPHDSPARPVTDSTCIAVSATNQILAYVRGSACMPPLWPTGGLCGCAGCALSGACCAA
jgi:hypothetical protein